MLCLYYKKKCINILISKHDQYFNIPTNAKISKKREKLNNFKNIDSRTTVTIKSIM